MESYIIALLLYRTTWLGDRTQVVDRIWASDINITRTEDLTQNWLPTTVQILLPDSPDLNALNYHVRGPMLEACHKSHWKLKTIVEFEEKLQISWKRPASGIDWQSFKGLTKRLYRLALKLTVDILNIRGGCRILAICCYRLIYTILRCVCRNVFGCAKIARRQRYNAGNFEIVDGNNAVNTDIWMTK